MELQNESGCAAEHRLGTKLAIVFDLAFVPTQANQMTAKGLKDVFGHVTAFDTW